MPLNTNQNQLNWQSIRPKIPFKSENKNFMRLNTRGLRSSMGEKYREDSDNLRSCSDDLRSSESQIYRGMSFTSDRAPKEVKNHHREYYNTCIPKYVSGEPLPKITSLKYPRGSSKTLIMAFIQSSFRWYHMVLQRHLLVKP